jgi:hypothetical protein
MKMENWGLKAIVIFGECERSDYYTTCIPVADQMAP